jgi:hypothetical protein
VTGTASRPELREKTHWIWGFITFRRVRHARTVMLVVSA